MCKPKVLTTLLITHKSLRVFSIEDWYYDSGCSMHMIGEKNYLKELRSYFNSYVTFGDGSRGKIKGISKLVFTGLRGLDDVLMVEGLPSN